MTVRLVVLIAAGVGGLVLGAATSASGYWTDADSSRASITVAALGAPGMDVVTDGPEVTVDVSAPATGPTPESYTVAVGSQVICTLAAPGPCIDAAGDGTRREYVVTARLGEHWTSTATASANTGDVATPAAAGAAPPGAVPDVEQPVAVPVTAPTGPVATVAVPTVAVPTGSSAAATTMDPGAPEVSDDDGLVTPHVTLVAVVPASPADSMPGSGDTIEITVDRALDPRTICGIWATSALVGQTLAHVTAILAPTPDPAHASLTLGAADGVCGPAGLVLGTITVDSRYLIPDVDSRPVAFTDSTLTISADGLTVTVLLGTAEAADRLQAVSDPTAPSFTVTDRAPRDLGGLPLAPGVFGGTGAF